MGATRCKRHSVNRKKEESSGSMQPLPLQFMAAWLGAWFARALQQQVDYLMAENQILKEKLGDRKLKLTDADRRRLSVLGKELGRKLLGKMATIAAPETIVGIENWWRRSTMAALPTRKARWLTRISPKSTLPPSPGPRCIAPFTTAEPARQTLLGAMCDGSNRLRTRIWGKRLFPSMPRTNQNIAFVRSRMK
jgi:hypothetical protein